MIREVSSSDKYIRWLSELHLDNIAQVGGKNASLGELSNALSGKILVPETFAVTAEAYRDMIDVNEIWPRMDQILKKTDWTDLTVAASMAARIRDMIVKARFPKNLEDEIRSAYRIMCDDHGRNTPVAVRSSATAEDLPEASFAGQHETYLNVRGADDLVQAVRKCFASLYTQRAISYRDNQGFDHRDVALSVGVQRMIRADKASSGVIFTLDTESGNADVVLTTNISFTNRHWNRASNRLSATGLEPRKKSWSMRVPMRKIRSSGVRCLVPTGRSLAFLTRKSCSFPNRRSPLKSITAICMAV